MILTFFYLIATSIQSRRILFLKTYLYKLFQKNTSNYPSIMFYNKTSLNSSKESKSHIDDYENDEFLTSSLCMNKNDARLDELLWYRGNTSLCTIYPQQKVDISSWLMYPGGQTYFPLYTNNDEISSAKLQSNYSLYVLVEADLESYKPLAEIKATKVEDYGIIIMWTVDKYIDLIIESDLDMVAKFFIAAMEGHCYINNGLLLKRIETVHISGTCGVYNNDLLNSPPTKKFIDKAEWDMHIEKLRSLSNTAKIATEQCKSLELKDFPDVTVFPGGKPNGDLYTQKAVSTETLESKGRSQASTPISTGTSEQKDDTLSTTMQHSTDNLVEFQGVSRSGSKSLDMLDNLDEMSCAKQFRQASCTDIKDSSFPIENIFYDFKASNAGSFTASSKNSMAEITSKLSKLSTEDIIPPNVLIYADSAVARVSVKEVLEDVLGTDRYTIYVLSPQEAHTDAWVESAALVVVCGNVGNEIGSQIVEYILRGGKLLALCSDIIHILLPSFKTAEVRENELVHFSYGKWKHVRMMHHIFCYQASPIRTRFSQDQEDTKTSTVSPPSSASVKDKKGNSHSFDVKVLGTEETWHTPSILLATLLGNGGKAVFSQIHLEVDPTQYELEESKYKALKESNAIRLEIFKELLNVHLGIELHDGPTSIKYTPAFFLGRHELKLEMLERLKDVMQSDDIIKTSKLEIQFCRGSTVPRSASASFLPIMLHQCPDNFSTVEYFESLTTKDIGRLVIYADVMTSSMDVPNGYQLQHGLAVIVRQQTRGQGRGKNMWLSPDGCAMFTLQLHVPVDTILGKRISILQCLVSVAIVSAIKSLPGYEEVDLRIKWPNDIYAGEKIKIGGILVSTIATADLNICNVGVGVNLFNKKPTYCINQIIDMINETYRKKLKPISYELYFAIVFNEVEQWLNTLQKGDIDLFLDAYYTYWLHSDAQVTVVSSSGVFQNAKILGIDEYGYLRVRGEDGSIFTVHPDGNSFDCLKGLIVPK